MISEGIVFILVKFVCLHVVLSVDCCWEVEILRINVDMNGKAKRLKLLSNLTSVSNGLVTDLLVQPAY